VGLLGSSEFRLASIRPIGPRGLIQSWRYTSNRIGDELKLGFTFSPQWDFAADNLRAVQLLWVTRKSIVPSDTSGSRSTTRSQEQVDV